MGFLKVLLAMIVYIGFIPGLFLVIKHGVDSVNEAKANGEQYDDMRQFLAIAVPVVFYIIFVGGFAYLLGGSFS